MGGESAALSAIQQQRAHVEEGIRAAAAWVVEAPDTLYIELCAMQEWQACPEEPPGTPRSPRLSVFAGLNAPWMRACREALANPRKAVSSPEPPHSQAAAQPGADDGEGDAAKPGDEPGGSESGSASGRMELEVCRVALTHENTVCLFFTVKVPSGSDGTSSPCPLNVLRSAVGASLLQAALDPATAPTDLDPQVLCSRSPGGDGSCVISCVLAVVGASTSVRSTAAPQPLGSCSRLAHGRCAQETDLEPVHRACEAATAVRALPFCFVRVLCSCACSIRPHK